MEFLRGRLAEIRSRIKLKAKDVPPENTKTITDLDANCMFYIFEYLSINDLAALSQMCKTLKQLTELFFYQNCETDPIDIVAWRNVAKFEFKETKEFAYEKCFASQIRSVHVNSRNAVQMCRCFEFIAANCPKNLVSFGASFLFIYEGLFDVDVNGEIIKDHLKNVKKVCLKNMFGGATFMRYCANVLALEFIFIERQFEESKEQLMHVINSNRSWMNGTYPKLRQLSVFVDDGFELNLNGFLARNSRIDDIICSGSQTIAHLCQSDHQFRRAALILQVKYNYSNIFDAIEEWNNNRGKCQELEISMSLHFNRLYFHEFALDVFRKLNSLRNLVAIHFTLLYDIDHFLSESKLIFPSVRKLCTSNRYGNLRNAKALDELFPNLEELELNQYRCSADFENTFRNHMLPVVAHFKNLRTLKFKTKMQEKMKFNFADDLLFLNSNRFVSLHRFNNSIKTLIIQLDPKYPIHSLSIPKGSLIEIQPFPDNKPIDCKLCCDSNYCI